MRLLIRADATPSMGTGHIMRSMALAMAAKEHGIAVHMLSHVGVDWVRQRLHNESVDVLLLGAPPAAQESPYKLLEDLARAAQGYDPCSCWMVLDGYHFGPDCQKAVRNAGYKLLVIDDYAHLPEYSCDILLNQNIGAERLTYRGDIGQKLLGLRYVLMRPEFAAAREKATSRIFSEPPKNILLTLGGGDFSGPLRLLAPHFSVPEMTGRTLRVISGAMPEHVLQECLRDCPAGVENLRVVEDMPALLLDTDLCITAGGSTCWELCCLGVPFMTLAVAENQQGVVAGLEQLCIAWQFSKKHLLSMLQGCDPRGFDLVDGNGVKRVILSCLQLSR